MSSWKCHGITTGAGKMKSRGYLPLKNPEDNQVDRERPYRQETNKEQQSIEEEEKQLPFAKKLKKLRKEEDQ